MSNNIIKKINVGGVDYDIQNETLERITYANLKKKTK